MEKNRKAMLEAIKSGNKVMEAQLRESEGWTEDDMMEIKGKAISALLHQKAERVTISELDKVAGKEDYFAN